VFDPPQSVTLWQLPEAVEEEFETHWERWPLPSLTLAV
jgi:hypothetical protein